MQSPVERNHNETPQLYHTPAPLAKKSSMANLSSAKSDNTLPAIKQRSFFNLTEIDVSTPSASTDAEPSKVAPTPFSTKSGSKMLRKLIESDQMTVEDVHISNILDPPVKLHMDILVQNSLKNITIKESSKQAIFSKYFSSDLSKKIINNIFWFSFCAFFKHDKLLDEDVEQMLADLSLSTTKLFWMMKSGERDVFFEIYHFAVSYCIVKALRKHFPGSKAMFTKKMQLRVYELMSELFTGIRLRRNYIDVQRRLLFPLKKSDFVSRLKRQKQRKATDKSTDLSKSTDSRKLSQDGAQERGFYSSDEEEHHEDEAQEDSDSDEEPSEFFKNSAPISDKILTGDDLEDTREEDWDAVRFMNQISNPELLDLHLSTKEDRVNFIQQRHDYVRHATKNLKKTIKHHAAQRRELQSQASIYTSDSAMNTARTDKRPRSEMNQKVKSPRYTSKEFDKVLNKMQSSNHTQSPYASRDKLYWNCYGLSPLIGYSTKEPSDYFTGHNVRLIRKTSSVHNPHFFNSQIDPVKRNKLIREYKRNWKEPPSMLHFQKSLKRQEIIFNNDEQSAAYLSSDLKQTKEKLDKANAQIAQEKKDMLEDDSGEMLIKFTNELVKKHQNYNVAEKRFVKASEFKGTQQAMYLNDTAQQMSSQLKTLSKKLDHKQVSRNDKLSAVMHKKMGVVFDIN